MMPGMMAPLLGFGSPYPGTVIELASSTNVNLFTLAGSPASAGTWSFVVPAGVTIGSTSASTPALRTGTFPAGSQVYLFNSGNIYGRGGNGGNASTGGNGGAGGAGGAAVYLDRDLVIDNTNGNIFGGGGGGGGGSDYRTYGGGG